MPRGGHECKKVLESQNLSSEANEKKISGDSIKANIVILNEVHIHVSEAFIIDTFNNK